MADKIIENNQVSIMGAIASEFEKSHEVYGEGFYMVDVLVKRLSGSEDKIPLMGIMIWLRFLTEHWFR